MTDRLPLLQSKKRNRKHSGDDSFDEGSVSESESESESGQAEEEKEEAGALLCFTAWGCGGSERACCRQSGGKGFCGVMPAVTAAPPK